MKNAFYISFIFTFFSAGLLAQSYSLEECKTMATENNAELRDKRIQEEISGLMKKQAISYLFPNVSGMGMIFEARNPIINLDLGILGKMQFLQDGMMASVMAVQPVFMGGKIINSIRLAQVGIQASELFTVQNRDEVLAQTEEYFWTLVTLYEKRKTVAIMQNVLDSLYKDVQQAHAVGILGQNDVLKVKLQKNTLASQKIELENGIFLCKMALAREVGKRVDSLDGFDIVVPESTIPANPLDFYTDPASALALRTEYKLLDLGVQAARLEKKIETAGYLPQAGVGAAYYYENFLDKNNWNGAVLAAVRVPISDWGRGLHTIKQKQLAEKRAVIRQEDGYQQLLMQIQQAWGTFVESYEKLLLADLSVEESQENARLNSEYFHAGTVSLTELLAAQGFLQVSYDNRTEAYKAYRLAKSKYLQVTGR
jgi:outer membrane protein TolC